jgi:type IV secretion system protein TrbL
MLLDSLLASFVSALVAGFAVLHVYSLPFLGVAAQLAWLRGVYPLIRAGIHPGEIWAHAVLMAISLAAYIFLLSHFRELTQLVFTLAADLGAKVGGLSGTVLLSPSGVFEAGTAAVSPIQDFLARMTGWTAIKSLHTILQYTLAYVLVMAAFLGVALNITLTIIEFHFAVLVATVLVPWAPLGPTAFLAEFSLGWVAGMVVRVLVQTAVIGLSIPLFETLVFTAVTEQDPDFWEALAVVGGALLFFLLSWIIPNRAVALTARGLAIGGDAVLAGASSAARGVVGFYGAGQQVAAGVSRLVRAERGQ